MPDDECYIGRMRNNLTKERLREVLEYNQETGEFRWKARNSNRIKIGAVAGAPFGNRGYRKIGVDGVTYYAHRLAWFYTYGAWPSQDTDHINGDRGDNRIANLRDVDRTTNMENIRTVVKNTKGRMLGVRRDKKKYAAAICVAGKAKNLGSFDTPEEAHEAYLQAKRKLHKGNTL
jgi:hypothetical protein